MINEKPELIKRSLTSNLLTNYRDIFDEYELYDERRKMTEKKKRGGGKLNRSETITVRLDPKLRYFTELAARKQRRTLSSYIGWILEYAIKDTWLNPDLSLDEENKLLWHTNEFERLKLLKIYHPELLTYKEELLLIELLKND